MTTTNGGTNIRLPWVPSNSNSEVSISGSIATTESFVVQATMATTDTAISPMIDSTRMGVIVRENIINNLSLAIRRIFTRHTDKFFVIVIWLK